MARDVDSLVKMIRVMASPDMFELDPSLPHLPFQEQMFKGNHKLRIGYYTWDGNLPSVPVVCRAVRQAKAALEALGHTVVDFSPPEYSEIYGKLYIGSMIGPDEGKTLRDAVKDDYMDVGLQPIRLNMLPRWIYSLLIGIIRKKEPVLSKAMMYARKDGTAYSWFLQAEEILNYRRRFIKEWRRLKLDAVICPVFPSPAPRTEHIGFLTMAGSGCSLYNVVNFPAGAVPVTKVTPQDVADTNNPKIFQAKTRLEGFLKKSCDQEESVGLPVAVQCVTLPFQEELCLRLMKELETALSYNTVIG